MNPASLTIDLAAIAQNWRDLDRISGKHVQTGAVVKANAYGLGVAKVAQHLAKVGVQTFFVATAAEGATLRQSLQQNQTINLFCGHMSGDTAIIRDHGLTPMLNSPEQLVRHLSELPDRPFGIQLDTGMHRLGIQATDWVTHRQTALTAQPTSIISHLACADEPTHPMNAKQLANFQQLTNGIDVPKSLAATGGILLGPDYHFDLTRPGIGLYGGQPFEKATQTVALSIPVIQVRDLKPGDSVGYGNTWVATRDTRIAAIAAGYADGLIRSLSNGATLFHDKTPCPLIGRISMDLITVDITELPVTPNSLDILCPHQSIDQLANAANTIGYEILTSLGPRYDRRYKGAI